jgi:hypothetical protein
MIHSSAAIRHGKAAFFLVKGRGGKTTVASQAPLATVLGDDQIILRKQNGKFLAYSTPWGRIIGDPISAMLGGFFLLEQAEKFELIPLKPRRMLEYLWNEHAHLTSVLPPKSRLRAFDLVDEAVHQVPLYRLLVPLNGIDWEAIDAAMGV